MLRSARAAAIRRADDAAAAGRFWQASHPGGHRFAHNVVVLPYGIKLGRASSSTERSGSSTSSRPAGIPLDFYRGPTVYAPPVQAADITVRSLTGVEEVGDLRLVAHVGDLVTFATPSGELAVRVEERQGPLVPASCGAEPEPAVEWATSLESSA
jgi:hypothetical protein